MRSGTYITGAERRSPWFNISLICLIMSALFYGLSQTVADPDLWGHVRFGQDLWQTGNIIRSDPYSYLTGDRLWVNHEWLSEVIFYLAFAGAGSAGVIVLKSAVSLLIMALLYAHMCRQGLNPLRAGIVLLALSLLISPWLSTVRPQIFTFLFFLLTLLLIRQAEGGRPRCLWMLPPMFALWANLHGGFLAGLGMLLVWTFAHLVSASLHARRPGVLISRSQRAIPLALVASVLATFVNPYGVQLLSFLLRTATVARNRYYRVAATRHHEPGRRDISDCFGGLRGRAVV